jgi:hypothetical protein
VGLRFGTPRVDLLVTRGLSTSGPATKNANFFIMNNLINHIKKFRIHLLNQIEGLSTEQLNHIPAGFNNNIIWNLGHLIAAQQNVCYIRSGLKITVDDQFFTPYLSGTKPENPAAEKEIIAIKKSFITSIDSFRADYDKKIFQNYTPSPGILKVYDIEVDNIDRAIEYLLFHEGLHAGYILSIKHVI